MSEKLDDIVEGINAGYGSFLTDELVTRMERTIMDFNEEMSILCEIRKHFDEREMILRVDANGSFSTNEAMNKLKSLADLGIHSIEQPIAKGQYEEMKNLCLRSPIPIALDDAVEAKMLEKNDMVLFAAFGGGFTWGSMLIKWS